MLLLLRLHHDALHGRLLLLLNHHWARLCLQHLLLHGDLLLLLHQLGLHAHHLRIVVLVHSRLRVRLLCIRVLPFCEHKTLNARSWCFSSVLHEHGCVISPSFDHEVPVLLLDLFQVFLDGLFRDVLLRVNDLADVGAPDGQAERNNEVEKDDVADEPPIERWYLKSAIL